MTAKQLQVGTPGEAIARRAAEVDYAYQPIVSSTSLHVHGFEAPARFPGDEDASKIVALLETASHTRHCRKGFAVCAFTAEQP